MAATRLEQRIFRDILAEDMPFEEGQKALTDPAAWKVQMKGLKNENLWRTEMVDTPRGTVYWVWTRHRNKAGYFVGWRKVIHKDGKVTEDQHTARRTKKRLAAFLNKKAAELRAKYPDQAAIRKKKRDTLKREQDARRRVPRFKPKEFFLYCTIIDCEGLKDPITHRTGAYASPEEAKRASIKDTENTPRSLLMRHQRIYRLYRAKWTQVELPAFTL